METDFLTRAIEPPDEAAARQVQANWDRVSKPIDGLGKFERIAARIGAIQGSDEVRIARRCILILCADNGVVEEGVSQTGQEVTAAVAEGMGRQETSVGLMAAQEGVDTIPVDVGIAREEPIPGVLSRKVRCGTRDFLREPAMTRDETVRAVRTGIELVRECRERGYDLIGTGEMGIGNTTTSSAICASLLHCPVPEVTGRGAGLSDSGLARKIEVIETAVRKYGLYEKDPLEVLQTVGGLDIAGLTGVCLGGAFYHVPIVLDGVISQTAALTAERMRPGVREFLIGSHRGKEPACRRLEQELGLDPVIEAELALGEGTGAVMLMGLLDTAMTVYRSRTFEDNGITPYERFTK